MSAEELIASVRPVLEELASRMRQTELECGKDALLWALYPMLAAHKQALDEATPEAQEWLNSLATAVFLIHPNWLPDDVMVLDYQYDVSRRMVMIALCGPRFPETEEGREYPWANLLTTETRVEMQ